MTCPCGQTYGTCAKHPGPPPRVASYTFIREDGNEFITWANKPKRQSDETWEQTEIDIAERIAETLIEVHA